MFHNLRFPKFTLFLTGAIALIFQSHAASAYSKDPKKMIPPQEGGYSGGGGKSLSDGLRELIDHSVCSWYSGPEFQSIHAPEFPEFLGHLSTNHPYLAFILNAELNSVSICETKNLRQLDSEDKDSVIYYTNLEETRQVAIRVNHQIFIDINEFARLPVHPGDTNIHSHRLMLLIHELAHSFIPMTAKRRNDSLLEFTKSLSRKNIRSDSILVAIQNTQVSIPSELLDFPEEAQELFQTALTAKIPSFERMRAWHRLENEFKLTEDALGWNIKPKLAELRAKYAEERTAVIAKINLIFRRMINCANEAQEIQRRSESLHVKNFRAGQLNRPEAQEVAALFSDWELSHQDFTECYKEYGCFENNNLFIIVYMNFPELKIELAKRGRLFLFENYGRTVLPYEAFTKADATNFLIDLMIAMVEASPLPDDNYEKHYQVAYEALPAKVALSDFEFILQQDWAKTAATQRSADEEGDYQFDQTLKRRFGEISKQLKSYICVTEWANWWFSGHYRAADTYRLCKNGESEVRLALFRELLKKIKVMRPDFAPEAY